MDSFLHDLTWAVDMRSDALTPVFRAFTWIGYSTFFMLFLPLGYWLWRKPMFLRMAVLVGISGILNVFLKDLLQDPRPDLAFRMDAEVGTSFGLPSGHAHISGVLWLWLAYEVRRGWMWALALFVIAGIGLSRLYLGVHDVEDVLGGLALASLTVAVAGWIMRAGFLDGVPLLTAALIALGAQAIVFALWPGADGPGGTTGLGAFLVGWLLGAAIEQRRIEHAPPEGWRWPVAGILGTAILLALFVGLTKASDALDPGGDVAMYGATFVIALYMTLGAPALFRALRLTTR